MRYSSTAALVTTLAATVAAAPPSLFNGQEHQLTFLSEHVLDPIAQQAAAYLQESKALIDSLTGPLTSAGGNVAEKGAAWIKEHINDPRFSHITHAAFPEYRLRVNKIAEPTLCDKDVKQYSGYLDIGDKKHLFFWFFESRRNPKKDPLTLWLNGGPGCSSSTGLLFELGPCLIAANGTKTVYNPYSWNEVSNMIFLDQPVNVGYSYTEGSQVLNTPDAAVDVYAFLQLFLKSFPEYSKQDFNIAGESYGGHYIPNFASYIHQQKTKVEQGDKDLTIFAKEEHQPINLKSLLIGNGLTDPYLQFASVPEYACDSKHAFLDDASCTSMKNKVPTCQRLESYCYDNPSRFTCVPAALYCWGMYSPLQATGRNLYDVRKKCDRNGEDGDLCYKEMGWIERYLNREEVKAELGVPADLDFASCNMDINRGFLMTGDSQHNSAALLPPMLADGIRVLIYAGTEDSMCNYLGNKEWFLALETIFSKDLQKTKERDFKVKGKVAGSLISVGAGSGNYTYLQIEEAGHMVPTDQPEAALKMFSHWLANDPL